MSANSFPVIEATNLLNRQAANYGDEATYEFLRIDEMFDENHAMLVFRVIIDGKVTKLVRLEFIVDEKGFVAAN
jgi:hypothetical protein